MATRPTFGSRPQTNAGGALDLRDVDALVEIRGESLLETVANSLPEVEYRHQLRTASDKIG